MNNGCLITNDVETTSIANHCLSDNIAEYLLKEGMPRLLDLYEKYNIKSTFFFTGHIAKIAPQLVKMILPHGHEVGSHGLTHDINFAFDVLTPEKQLEHLRISKDILENITGHEVISFRAPAARVQENTAEILLEAGYKIDSSISSQRFDMFMSFGALKKMNWLTTPRLPYFTKENNIFKRGNSGLLEIPISAMIFPYIGTFMRVSPVLLQLTRVILYAETRINNRPFVFLTHPNEFIDEKVNVEKIQRRGNNFITYLLGDVVRHKLKIRNLGKAAIPLLEKELMFFNKNNFEFITMGDYYNRIRK